MHWLISVLLACKPFRFQKCFCQQHFTMYLQKKLLQIQATGNQFALCQWEVAKECLSCMFMRRCRWRPRVRRLFKKHMLIQYFTTASLTGKLASCEHVAINYGGSSKPAAFIDAFHKTIMHCRGSSAHSVHKYQSQSCWALPRESRMKTWLYQIHEGYCSKSGEEGVLTLRAKVMQL